MEKTGKRKNGKIEMKALKYWYITAYGKYAVAHGIVSGHERLPDGQKIHTSYIRRLELREDGAVVIRTKNSEYHCKLGTACFHRFDEVGKRFLPDFKKLQEKYERKLEIPDDGDGVLIVLDSEAEYNFVGALFQVGDRKKEFHDPDVHIGMFQDSVLLEWYDRASDTYVGYCYFPTPSQAEFYRWVAMKTYIQNVGIKEIEVSIDGNDYQIAPGGQLFLIPKKQ